MNKTIIISILLLMLAGLMLLLASGFPSVTGQWMSEPSFFPMLIATLLIISCIVVIVEELKGSKFSYKANIPNISMIISYIYIHRKVLIAMLVSLGYVFLMRLFGFFLSTFCFSFGLMIIKETKARKIPRFILMAIVLTVFTFFIFTKIFIAILPSGTIYTQ